MYFSERGRVCCCVAFPAIHSPLTESVSQVAEAVAGEEASTAACGGWDAERGVDIHQAWMHGTRRHANSIQSSYNCVLSIQDLAAPIRSVLDPDLDSPAHSRLRRCGGLHACVDSRLEWSVLQGGSPNGQYCSADPQIMFGSGSCTAPT